ncbi:hypothetical protein LCGC14_2865150 [marine sediment metagenome]|uniref:Uncharacterized protein n=1 Tax=marine sediment metagenome TaxID=412755 RepID=A0A0F9AVP6_9ZZZZ
MLQQSLSNDLWGILKLRGALCLFDFSIDVQEGVRVENFLIWQIVESGRRVKRRDYYRTVRDITGVVLYDQLEDVSRKFVDEMRNSFSTLVPDIRMSPNRANKLLNIVIEGQRQVDKMITAAQNV